MREWCDAAVVQMRRSAGEWVPVGERLPEMVLQPAGSIDHPAPRGWLLESAQVPVLVLGRVLLGRTFRIEPQMDRPVWCDRQGVTHWLDVKLPASSGEEA